jgi:sucrose-6-phosphate hydrolase SacC (GH32 family)
MSKPESALPTIEARFYSIVARSSSKEAAVYYASLNNDAPIVQFERNTGFNQQWRFSNYGMYTQIFARHSGKCMIVYENRIEQDAYIVQYDNFSDDNQLWQLIDVGQGFYAIKTKNKNLYITIEGNSLGNDARLLLYGWANKNNQKFEIISPVDLTTLSKNSTQLPEGTVLHSADLLLQTD